MFSLFSSLLFIQYLLIFTLLSPIPPLIYEYLPLAQFPSLSTVVNFSLLLPLLLFLLTAFSQCHSLWSGWRLILKVLSEEKKSNYIYNILHITYMCNIHITYICILYIYVIYYICYIYVNILYIIYVTYLYINLYIYI